jgi:hypothetical protein
MHAMMFLFNKNLSLIADNKPHKVVELRHPCNLLMREEI